MKLSEPLIHCVNSACSKPLNPPSHKVCENCQTPLVHRYLWAVEPDDHQIPPGELVQDRYYVAAPLVWLDTRPNLTPHIPEPLPDTLIPYLRLYPQRLHIPEVYGYAVLSEESIPTNILLLENVPVDAEGNLMPSILQAWHEASAVRQVYWLWQILELWKPLAEIGVASSLFVADNIRVEGWRVRLRELYPDRVGDTALAQKQVSRAREGGNSSAQLLTSPTLLQSALKPSLEQLGLAWASWFGEPQRQVRQQLQNIYQQMQTENASLEAIAHSLNQLLLEQAAQLSFSWRVAGATDTGPAHNHNEDSCHPKMSELSSLDTGNGRSLTLPSDPVREHFSIVCDGIGGHEGGEVASQLAVQSVKLQVQALLAELAEDPEIMTPDLVVEQLEAIIRVANNLIAARNDEQGRESRRRMGTTLVMALQLPQQVRTLNSTGNSHELYIAHVGDSRAYWITPNYCQQLTVDDDLTTREVRTGRKIYRQMLDRPDAGALTQAMGTRDSEFLRPTVQRFIVEEDGLLLLCSDGLSDNNLVEQSWAAYVEPILAGQMSVESAVQSLIDLANHKNGHDNTSVVMTYFRVSPEYPVLFNRGEAPSETIDDPVPEPSDFSEADRVFMDAQLVTVENTESPAVAPKRGWLTGLGGPALGLLSLLIIGGAVAFTTWLVTSERSPKPPIKPEIQQKDRQ
jgi:protein phosphatase